VALGRVNIKPDLEDVVGVLGELSAVYGQPKDRSPQMAEIMAKQWLVALEHLPLEAIRQAVQKHIRDSKFWPVPAEIVEIARDEAKALRERVQWAKDDLRPPPSLQLTAPADPEPRHPPFRPTEEEMGRVSAMCANWRKQFAPTVTDRFDEWAPASQDPNVSDALKAVMAKRRAREATQ
jgi:hypothetical protein